MDSCPRRDLHTLPRATQLTQPVTTCVHPLVSYAGLVEQMTWLTRKSHRSSAPSNEQGRNGARPNHSPGAVVPHAGPEVVGPPEGATGGTPAGDPQGPPDTRASADTQVPPDPREPSDADSRDESPRDDDGSRDEGPAPGTRARGTLPSGRARCGPRRRTPPSGRRPGTSGQVQKTGTHSPHRLPPGRPRLIRASPASGHWAPPCRTRARPPLGPARRADLGAAPPVLRIVAAAPAPAPPGFAGWLRPAGTGPAAAGTTWPGAGDGAQGRPFGKIRGPGAGGPGTRGSGTPGTGTPAPAAAGPAAAAPRHPGPAARDHRGIELVRRAGPVRPG